MNVFNRRSFLSLPNLLDALETVSLHPHASDETYLLADQETISISNLVDAISPAQVGRSANLISCPDPIYKLFSAIPYFSAKINKLTSDLVVDSSKIRDTLSWVQPVSQKDAMLQAFVTRYSQG